MHTQSPDWRLVLTILHYYRFLKFMFTHDNSVLGGVQADLMAA
jgi:hypothetical protein